MRDEELDGSGLVKLERELQGGLQVPLQRGRVSILAHRSWRVDEQAPIRLLLSVLKDVLQDVDTVPLHCQLEAGNTCTRGTRVAERGVVTWAPWRGGAQK